MGGSVQDVWIEELGFISSRERKVLLRRLPRPRGGSFELIVLVLSFADESGSVVGSSVCLVLHWFGLMEMDVYFLRYRTIGMCFFFSEEQVYRWATS